MSLEYIRKTYGVPAKRGARVRDDKGREGKIVGARGPHISVKIDGMTFPAYYHPTSVTYLNGVASVQSTAHITEVKFSPSLLYRVLDNKPTICVNYAPFKTIMFGLDDAKLIRDMLTEALDQIDEGKEEGRVNKTDARPNDC